MDAMRNAALESKEYLLDKQVINDMSNGVIAILSNGSIIKMNPVALGLFELGEPPTKFAQLMQAASSEQNDDFFGCILDAVFEREITRQRKVPFVSPSGERYSLHVSSSYLTMGNESGVVVTIADETVADTLRTKRDDSLVVLVCGIVVLGISVFSVALWELLGKPFPSDYLSRFNEFLSVAAMAIFLRFTTFTLADMGLTSSNLRRDLREAVVIAAVMVAVLAVAKAVLVALGNPYFDPSKPFVSWEDKQRMWYPLTYLLIALFQEFLARCVMQENLLRIFEERKNGQMTALVVSSLIFGGFHLHYGFVYMVGAAIVMGGFGLIYQRQRSIWGSYLVHYVFGIAGKLLHWIV